jgi:uracil-DNA glycosylase family 4
MMAGYAGFRVARFLYSKNSCPRMNRVFDAACRRCPRLAAFLDSMRIAEPDYYNLPVPPFGDPEAKLLIVGLAPGMHGANRSGRPFTGDHAGILLYATLHKFGLATAPVSVSAQDGLSLINVRITNAVKCLPPANKPVPAEIKLCNDYLRAELEAASSVRVFLALGTIAHQAVLRAVGHTLQQFPFGHGAEHRLSGACTLLDSYHCSRYNTQTRRLTAAMFEAVVKRGRELALAP